MQEKTYKEYLLEYAKKEFEVAKFDQTELSKSMLNFLEEAANFTKNEPESMKKLVDIFHLLLNRFPIVPITENDFVEEIYKEDGKPDYKIWRCTRYEHVYKTEDGRYWDDRAVGFRLSDSSNDDVIYMYQGQNGSKREIQLPYYPDNKIEIIDSL
jgi:antitoxin component YwqK of YwqJK toxin-antitoxin module